MWKMWRAESRRTRDDVDCTPYFDDVSKLNFNRTIEFLRHSRCIICYNNISHVMFQRTRWNLYFRINDRKYRGNNVESGWAGNRCTYLTRCSNNIKIFANTNTRPLRIMSAHVYCWWGDRSNPVFVLQILIFCICALIRFINCLNPLFMCCEYKKKKIRLPIFK